MVAPPARRAGCARGVEGAAVSGVQARRTGHDRDASRRAQALTMSYTLYGWQVSYYTGKVRSYLRFKGIPFVEKPPNIFGYYFGLRRRTGAVAIPMLPPPDGQLLQR